MKTAREFLIEKFCKTNDIEIVEMVLKACEEFANQQRKELFIKAYIEGASAFIPLGDDIEEFKADAAKLYDEKYNNQ